MPSVLINALLLSNISSGIHYYIDQLIRNLDKINPSFEICVVLPAEYEGELDYLNNIKILKVNIIGKSRIYRIIAENIEIPFLIAKHKFCLFHGPAYLLPYNIQTKCVVTIHDLISFQFPEFCNSYSSFYFKRFIPQSITKANKIISISQTVKRDICSRFTQVNPSKIDVIYHGVRENFAKIENINAIKFIKQKYKLPDKFILYLGNIEPKKNVLGVIKSFQLFKSKSQNSIKLVLSGRLSWKYKEELDYYNSIENDIKDAIIFTGFIEDQNLPVLYSLAEVFLFPSYYEGFGLPPIEAMSCGCPVIISNRGALPEICGNDVIKVNPDNYEEIANAIDVLVNNTFIRNKNIAASSVFVKKYKWQQTAQNTFHTYKGILENDI